ncbi:MAG: quinoprotein dehydrogenase-associated SoxYZ-like carrier [Granulosicoccus sp.]
MKFKAYGLNQYTAQILSVLLLFICSVSTAMATGERWAELRKAYFGDAAIVTGDSVISLQAPKRAHDAAVVPVSVSVEDDSRTIRELYLFVDQNPLPLAGIFRFTEEAGYWKALETRIRINEYTDIRAIAVLANGELHMTERFVKASGGCSAPALADLDAAMANAGKMKLMLNEVYSEPDLPVSEAVIKISHPNNSGMQFDQVSRNYIPAFYVNTIRASLDGVEVMSIETNFSMSENPVVRLGFGQDVRATTLEVVAIDSKGNEYSRQANATAFSDQ